jgi:hypothetical protein
MSEQKNNVPQWAFILIGAPPTAEMKYGEV